MVKYECDLGYRPRIGPSSICDKCITTDCTNPIYEISVNVIPFGPGKERLWSDSKKPLEKRKLRDYYCVLCCKGFKSKKK